MSLPSIMKIPASWRPAFADKKLRLAAAALAALVLANLIAYFVLVSPSAARLAASEATFAEYRKRHAEAVLFQKRKAMLTGIVAGIPSQKDMPLLVKDLVQMARRLDLKVATVNYDMPRPGGGALAVLAFSFPVEGRYGDIKRFIHDIETSDRIVGIQDLRLESDKGMVTLNMKLMTYVKGQ